MAKQKQNLTFEGIDKLLSQQTVVILGAVDKKIDGIEKKLEKTRNDLKKEIDKLRISIDKFVGFYTKQEQEFTIIKEHLKRLEVRITKLEMKFA